MRSGIRRARLAATISLVVLAVAGCAPSHGAITAAPNGLRTFRVFHETNGNPVACPAFALTHPVAGTLEGDQSDKREPVWLETADGRRLSVVWPEGFTVRFEPDAVLYNELGKVVARAGQRTELSQTSPEEHAGTFDDPYLASGLTLGGCYPYQ
jgi:hypothetical protein